MPLTAKQISALVDAGATDDEIHAMHAGSGPAGKPTTTTPYLAAQDKAQPPTHQPNVSDPPWLAALKETLKIDPSQTSSDIGQYLKSLGTGTAKAVGGAVTGAMGAAAHPMDTLMSYLSGPVNQVKEGFQHPTAPSLNMENISKLRDPSVIGEQVGPALAAEAIPGAVGGIGRLLGRAPEAVTNAIGGVGGAAAGSSVGHPYVGFGLGTKYGGPIVRSAADLAGKVQPISKLLEAGGGPAESAGEVVRGAEMYKPGTIPMHDRINADVPQPAPRARVSTAQPSMMPAHDTGYGGDVVSNPEVNPKTASAGSLPAAGARDTMLKDIFGGEDLRDVFNGKGGVQRRPLPAGMRGDYPPDVGGEYSNYPQEFQHVGGGTTPPAAGNQNDYKWQKITAPEVPSRTEVPEETAAQLETATEPRVSVQGLDKATTPEVAPEDAGESESPASKLAKILGTPSDADVAAAIAKRQYKG